MLLGACGEKTEPAKSPVAVTGQAPDVAVSTESEQRPQADSAERTALFGAVHVHTSYSFDAFTNGTVSHPRDAYEWAKGNAIKGNKAGLMIQVKKPLDFYAVSDHSEMMGVFPPVISNCLSNTSLSTLIPIEEIS